MRGRHNTYLHTQYVERKMLAPEYELDIDFGSRRCTRRNRS